TFRRLEFGEVVIGEVTLESVRNENIRDTVNVEVFYQYTPAPVGIGHSGELADLAECAVSIVQVKHIAHILRMQTASNHGIKHVVLIDTHELLLPVVVLRQHVEGKNVHMLIAVNVDDVGAHGEFGYVA